MNLYDFLIIKNNVISDFYCTNLMRVANEPTDDAETIEGKELKKETETFDFTLEDFTSKDPEGVPSKVSQDRVTLRYHLPTEIQS